ncbi:MAG: arsenate reductase ArsC [Nevskiales bacterium]
MKRVLFVCIENSCRSQMAEAFAHMYSGDDIEAYSSGSRPSGQVNPRAIQFMKELDYDLSSHGSKPLNQLPDITFDATITMGCGDECPYIAARMREDWGLDDPKLMSDDDFRAIRDEIGERVKDLLERLRAQD